MTEAEKIIADSILNDDYNNIYQEIQIGNVIVEVKGRILVDGYGEDDYFNGTGAFVATDAEIDLTFSLSTYDEDRNDTEEVLQINENTIIEYIKREILNI
jgi:hypothetical protein